MTDEAWDVRQLAPAAGTQDGLRREENCESPAARAAYFVARDIAYDASATRATNSATPPRMLGSVHDSVPVIAS